MRQASPPRRAIDTIAKQFNTTKLNASRVIMTESAYFASEAQKDCYKELGLERYEIVGALDKYTCEICSALDGKVYEMSQYEVGATAPPFHPWCRCCTAPYFEDMEGLADRIARDPTTGEQYNVPDNMTYEEWRNKYLYSNSKMKMADSDTINWPPKGEKLSSEEFKELREYATQRGVNLQRFKNSDVDIELTKELIDDAASMLKKYPELSGDGRKKFTLELSYNMNNEDFAQTFHGITHIIYLNGNALRSKEQFASEYKLLEESGWFVKGTDYHSVIFHEVGHLLEDINKIDSLDVMKKMLNVDNTADVILWCKNNISKYSASYNDGSEFVSEMLSAYENGPSNDNVLTFLKMCGIIK